MKRNFFRSLISRHKVATIATGVLVLTLVSGAVYVNTPAGQDSFEQFTKTTPLTHNGDQAQAESISPYKSQGAFSQNPDHYSLPTPKASLPTVSDPVVTSPAELTTEAATQATLEQSKQAKVPVNQTEPTQTQPPPTETASPPPPETAPPPPPETAPPPPPETAPPANNSLVRDTSMAQQVLDLVNQERSNAGLGALSWDDTLTDSACIRAQEILISWSHTRPDGSPWYTAGAQKQMGENLAYGQTSAEQVMSEWMASSGHRENILDGRYTQLGVACYYDPNTGVYYWAQHFA